MLSIAIFDFSKVFYKDLSPLLPKDEQKRLTHGKSEAYRRASAAGRALLFALFRATMGKEAPTVFSTKLGAPYFATSHVRFSISHDDTVVAVALSPTEKAVGVDVQSFESVQRFTDEHLSSLKDRYRLLTRKGDCPEIRLLKAELRGENFTFLPMECTAPKADFQAAFLSDFTLTEALLKACGTGFSKGKSSSLFLEDYESGTLCIKDDTSQVHVMSFCSKGK